MSAKKESTKKPTVKEVKKPVTKAIKVQKEIGLKQVGQTIVAIVDGTKHSKAIKDKVERDAFIALIKAYNASNSIAKEKQILNKLLENKGKPTVEKIAEKAKAVKKTEEKPTEAAQKQLNNAKIAEAKALLEKDGYTVSKVAPVSQQRRGEYN